MSETPLFRDGKAILKVRKNPDGSSTLFKPFTIKPAHLMNITGAPGWDKRYVDQVFSEGVGGNLRYFHEGVQYDIDIGTFRTHAFIRNDAGEQYHCAKRHYKTIGMRNVSPLREVTGPVMPGRFTFGEHVPCSSCKGERRPKPCTTCNGVGFVPWNSSSAT